MFGCQINFFLSYSLRQHYGRSSTQSPHAKAPCSGSKTATGASATEASPPAPRWPASQVAK